MTLLDSRLLSEYAFQRTAGAAVGPASRNLARKDASSIEQLSTDQEEDSVNDVAEINALDQNTGAHETE